jgi:hypothetical protein
LLRGFLGLQFFLEPCEHNFELFAVCWILGIVQCGFYTLVLRNEVPDTRLSFDELGMHPIQPPLRASDYRFLELCTIKKNLNSRTSASRAWRV